MWHQTFAVYAMPAPPPPAQKKRAVISGSKTASMPHNSRQLREIGHASLPNNDTCAGVSEDTAKAPSLAGAGATEGPASPNIAGEPLFFSTTHKLGPKNGKSQWQLQDLL